MKWGESQTLNRSDGATVFDTSQGFEGVWHLNENPENGSNAIKDRTRHEFNGTPSATMSIANMIKSNIGTGIKFNGDNQYIIMDQLNLKDTYSLSCWIKADDLTSARRFIWKEYSYTLWYDL